MATEQVTIEVSAELADAVRRASAAAGQSMSDFTVAAWRLELIAVEAGGHAPAGLREADLRAVLSLPT
ncbi:hypothetical protein AB0H58_03590 [Nocardia neocaledoniensis]|jgi:hypothetical protein|uniref:Ribbon-helix-helix CopG family protein n=1 Tax=Nocardia neocaledoniensis TaxID=236511 RepID=A0A317N4W7_9NOCA|nr:MULTISPECIES: hypothetical protein [Nocardia]PWV70335.1 hypothetical protein DFR69_11348 [Nocardia neocaledoniensis]UGT56075.1 hypothetical protein LTT85_04080 [Nocardia asteroides]